MRLLGLTGELVAARAEAEELGKRLGPDDPTAWIELGHALELAHQYDQALEAYDAAGAAAPASPVGPREGGMRAARWGEAEWARPRLEEATRRGANEPEVWHALGLVRGFTLSAISTEPRRPIAWGRRWTRRGPSAGWASRAWR